MFYNTLLKKDVMTEFLIGILYKKTEAFLSNS